MQCTDIFLVDQAAFRSIQESGMKNDRIKFCAFVSNGISGMKLVGIRKEGFSGMDIDAVVIVTTSGEHCWQIAAPSAFLIW